MVKTTIIARIADGLPLAASMDDEQVDYIGSFLWLNARFTLNHRLKQN